MGGYFWSGKRIHSLLTAGTDNEPTSCQETGTNARCPTLKPVEPGVEKKRPDHTGLEPRANQNVASQLVVNRTGHLGKHVI